MSPRERVFRVPSSRWSWRLAQGERAAQAGRTRRRRQAGLCAARHGPVAGQQDINPVRVFVSDLHSPFFAENVDGIDEVARAEGFELIINTGGRHSGRERDAVTRLVSFRPAGLALLGPGGPTVDIATVAQQLPVVVVARPGRIAAADTVNDDGRLGARLALDHLVGLGHTRITHFDGGATPEVRIRRDGYTAAMRAHGCIRM